MHTPDMWVQLLAVSDSISTFTTLKLLNREKKLFFTQPALQGRRAVSTCCN